MLSKFIQLHNHYHIVDLEFYLHPKNAHILTLQWISNSKPQAIPMCILSLLPFLKNLKFFHINRIMQFVFYIFNWYNFYSSTMLFQVLFITLYCWVAFYCMEDSQHRFSHQFLAIWTISSDYYMHLQFITPTYQANCISILLSHEQCKNFQRT